MYPLPLLLNIMLVLLFSLREGISHYCAFYSIQVYYSIWIGCIRGAGGFQPSGAVRFLYSADIAQPPVAAELIRQLGMGILMKVACRSMYLYQL